MVAMGRGGWGMVAKGRGGWGMDGGVANNRSITSADASVLDDGPGWLCLTSGRRLE